MKGPANAQYLHLGKGLQAAIVSMHGVPRIAHSIILIVQGTCLPCLTFGRKYHEYSELEVALVALLLTRSVGGCTLLIFNDMTPQLPSLALTGPEVYVKWDNN